MVLPAWNQTLRRGIDHPLAQNGSHYQLHCKDVDSTTVASRDASVRARNLPSASLVDLNRDSFNLKRQCRAPRYDVVVQSRHIREKNHNSQERPQSNKEEGDNSLAKVHIQEHKTLRQCTSTNDFI
jgi:hypothetical protein